MTATMNAGGGDWLDLPTQPIQHRGGKRPEGLPWAQITEQYVANGGQVDAGVWHQGPVQIVESGRRGKDRVHTYTERGGYQEPGATSTELLRARYQRGAEQAGELSRKLDPALRPEIARRYKDGESIGALSKAYGVPTGSVQWALKKAGVKTRTMSEAAAIRRGKAETS